ncbi:hypothetical protein EPI10_029692 [Gossypium australe]|uniref:Uncharacterized protein n=1 Tax=Gossypium australe TaxID=47621 RepID=A0A5B6V266_9ROSI|nr:hypothetical protein EPI10_029692 [Gossypium australe]
MVQARMPGAVLIVPTGTSVLVTHCDYGHQRFGTSRGLVPHRDLSLWLKPPWVTLRPRMWSQDDSRWPCSGIKFK